jgi:hypothetical protein
MCIRVLQEPAGRAAQEVPEVWADSSPGKDAVGSIHPASHADPAPRRAGTGQLRLAGLYPTGAARLRASNNTRSTPVRA